MPLWQPRGVQWLIIWPVALLLILAWPPKEGRSLGVKVLNWIVDPGHALPALPEPLPMGLDDDGDAVAAHDLQSAAYYSAYDSSGITHWRMVMKEWVDPSDLTTERQLLVALGIIGALIVWRLDQRQRSR